MSSSVLGDIVSGSIHVQKAQRSVDMMHSNKSRKVQAKLRLILSMLLPCPIVIMTYGKRIRLSAYSLIKKSMRMYV